MFEVFSRIKRKHEVKLFCGYYSPVGYTAEKCLNIEGVITRTKNDVSIPGYGPVYASCVSESVRRISRYKPDVVFVNSGYEYVTLLCRQCEGSVIPYVLSTDWYRSNFLANTSTWRIPYLEKLASIAARSPSALKSYQRLSSVIGIRELGLRRCKVNLCISNHISRFLKQLDPKIRTRVVPLGVDHKVFKPTFEDQDYLLIVTRIQPTKNQMLAVNAVKGTDYKLRIYGNMERYEPYERYYRELLSAKGKNVQISLNKSERTIIQELQKCSLFLNPARNEGVPLVDLEAMACGKFVIGHKSGGQIELLKETGMVCGDDPNEWRAHINDLMKDRNRRIELGRQAHHATLTYSWDNTAQKVQQAIEEYG